MTVSSVNKMKGFTVITCILLLQQHTRTHAAPPIEPCPHDSVQVEDTCKCDPERCTKPLCPYELTISINGTNDPGNCCTIYSCEGCNEEDFLNGKCPCALDAILNFKGECECIDPHKSLKNNECICNPDLCELPQICGENEVAVTVQDGCCPKKVCKTCPDDSFSTNYNNEALEDVCVCYPCKDKECAPNEKVVIMQNGTNFPGTCCDMYKCEKSEKDDDTKCLVEGIIYNDGAEWYTPDGQYCTCQKGLWFCSKSTEDEENFHSCHKEGSVYKHNESWMLDSCTNCTCVNGETKCIAHMCEVSEGHFNKPECQPLICNKVCPDGHKLNKRGCKICKCNISVKNDDILQEFNITKSQLKKILADYFDPSKNETNIINVTVANNVSDEYHIVTPYNQPGGCHPTSAVMWLAIGCGIGMIVMFILCLMWKCCQRNKGSHDTIPTRTASYERMPLPLCSNNNYIPHDNKDDNVKGSF